MKRLLSKTMLLRAAILPVGAVMVTAPILVGYASIRHSMRLDRAVEQQVVRFDPKSSTRRLSNAAREDKNDKNDKNEGNAADPVEDYKTALELLQKNYYGANIDKKKQHQLTYEAIKGMVGSLKDQFSSFLDPDDWAQMQATTEGDFEGIGTILAQDGAAVRIVEVVEGSPAEKAGVHADDVVTRVDGINMAGQDMNEVVRHIKGKRGTKARLTVSRGKQTLDFTLARSLVEPIVVKYWMEDNQAKVGRILLKEFNKKSVDQMNKAFDALQAQGMRALILDLRYNPGGLLDSAIDVASIFIPENKNADLHNVVVWMREGSGGEQKRLLGPVDTTYTRKVPLALLVNGGSASASEIVSGAIKDYGIATLIGERTYGKGRVQTLIPLQDNSALRLTTQLYYPPKHHDINFKRDEDGSRIDGTGGILPDIEVKQSPKWKPEDWNDKANDTQLHAAVDFLRSRLGGSTIAQATLQAQQVH